MFHLPNEMVEMHVIIAVRGSLQKSITKVHTFSAVQYTINTYNPRHDSG